MYTKPLYWQLSYTVWSCGSLTVATCDYLNVFTSAVSESSLTFTCSIFFSSFFYEYKNPLTGGMEIFSNEAMLLKT